MHETRQNGQHAHSDDHKPGRVHPSKREARDLRNNRVLLYLSIFITVLSLVGFFWLAGILDWRGSEGKFTLRVSYNCQNIPQTFTLHLGLAGENALARLSLNAENIDPSCNTVTVLSEPPAIKLTRFLYGNAIATEHSIFREGDNSAIASQDVFPLEAIRLGNTQRLELILAYERSSLLKYVGLSERYIAIETNIRTDQIDSPKSAAAGEIVFRLPEGFEVAESSIAGEFGNRADEWKVEIPESSFLDRPLVKVKIVNDRFARLDHIIDSSIAALLGVGVGGIITSYLALILLRRSHQQRSG